MKRILVLLLALLIVPTACNRYAGESINRTVIGKLVEVDKVGDGSILKFADGTTILVSNGSLSHWNTDRMITGGGMWVINLHAVNHLVYDVVSITDHVPIGPPTTTPSS